MRERLPALGVAAGAGLALIGLVGTLAGDGPYLSLSALSASIVAWAVGLFVLLILVPFAVHRRVADSADDRGRRWELAVVIWGGGALIAAVAFGAVAVAAGFSSSDPLGALAIVGLLECGLVVGSVLLLMLTTG